MRIGLGRERVGPLAGRIVSRSKQQLEAPPSGGYCQILSEFAGTPLPPPIGAVKTFHSFRNPPSVRPERIMPVSEAVVSFPGSVDNRRNPSFPKSSLAPGLAVPMPTLPAL